jgi:pyrimidine-nucleoside phosphorylase
MPNLTPIEIIRRKRDGATLSPEIITDFIDGYVRGVTPDYQAAAFLMAAFVRGLDADETAALTLAMLHSGTVLDFSDIPGVKTDKHSTGGVGDKTSLVLAPLAAAERSTNSNPFRVSRPIFRWRNFAAWLRRSASG